MSPTPYLNIETELLQLQGTEFRAKAVHHLDGDQEPNIFDRLADACKRKIAVLEELNSLARIQEAKVKMRFERWSQISIDRIQ
jgi:hypothetical protein